MNYTIITLERQLRETDESIDRCKQKLYDRPDLESLVVTLNTLEERRHNLEKKLRNVKGSESRISSDVFGYSLFL